jgi:phosphoserine phosphatase RsbU/P
MTGKESHSILAAPMRNPQQKIIGVVELINKRGGAFSSRDERLLTAMASQAAISIENARLYAQEMRQQLLNKDLETARRIQQSFLPQNVPHLPGWEIAAFWHPMREIGGDFYDFYRLDDDRLAVSIADVTDKGVPAALFMAFSVTVLRFAMTLNFSPAVMMERANQVILANQRSSMFTTAFVAYLDWQTGELQYASAGHNPPILYRTATKRCHYLKAGGVALGVFKDVMFEEKRLIMEPGDILVLYTDGITEIINPREEEFGEDRLEQIILHNITCSAEELGQRIMDANDQFAEGIGDFDDETLIVIKRV